MKLPTKQYNVYLSGLAAALCLFAAPSFAQDIFWTEQNVIMGSDIDGQNPVEVFDGTSQMDGLAVDVVATDTHLYWSDHAGAPGDGEPVEGGIWRANLDGTGAELLVDGDAAGVHSIHFIAIEEDAGKIYFSSYTDGIFQADLADGGNVVNLRSSGTPNAFTGVAINTPGAVNDGGDEGPGTLYWTSANIDYLYQADYWGDSPVTQLPGANGSYGLVYDADTQMVYYTSFSDGTLRSHNLSTGESALLKLGLQQPLGVKLSPSGSHLLIAERGKGVSAFQIDNFGYALLADAADAHFGVAVTADPAALPPGEDPGDLPYLFRANFDGDAVDGPPANDWGSISGPGEGTGTVLVDTDEDVFGRGAENQFLRAEGVRSYGLTGSFESTEVLTLSFDYIGRVNFGDGSRWINVEIRNGGRAHITSLRNVQANIRGSGNPSYGGNDRIVRFDTIMNNSSDTVTYDTPDGGTADLASGQASLWLYHYDTGEWEHVFEEYLFAGGVDVGTPLDHVKFNVDSGENISYDLDNVYVFDGAVVGELFEEANPVTPPQPDPLPVAWSLAPGDRSYITGSVRNRGMAIHPTEGYLAVVHRDAPTVALLDGLTGGEIDTLSTNGIAGGTFILNEIGIDEAGVTYAGNLSVDTSSNNYRLYRWTDKDAEPDVVFDAPLNSSAPDGSDRRFGDSIVVLGSGADTEIFLGTWSGTVIARLTPSGDAGDPTSQFAAEVITTDVPGGVLRDLSAGPGDNLYAPSGGGLYELEVDRTALTATTVSGTILGVIEPLAYSATDGYIGGIDTNATEFYLFDAATSETLALNPFPTNNTYPNAHGQVVFGNGMVYALAADNGILAMDLDLDSGSDSFESWIAGFGLPAGETGPDADPDADGIKNLLEYALDLNPSESSRNDLPAAGVAAFTVDSVANDYLTLEFTTPDSVADVGYAVTVSSDLGSWTADAVLEDSTSNGDGTTTYLYRDSAPLDAADRRFMQLEVSQQ